MSTLGEIGGPVVVLGGSGWLGSHVVDGLRASSVHAVEVSRHPRLGPGARELDLAGTGADELADLIAGAAAVVNCTDGVNATDGGHRPAAELAVLNVDLVARLVEAAGRTDTLLVHLGTILEYGAGRERPSRESDPCDPVSDYARGKAEGSRAVLAASRAGRCRAVVLRAGNLVGPRPATTAFPGRLTRVLARAEREGTVADLTAAPDERDFVDVRDVAEGVLAAVADAGRSADLLNLSAGRARPVLELITELVAASGLPAEQVRVERRALSSLGGGRTCASPARAATALGWVPRRTLRESARDMWASRADVLR